MDELEGLRDKQELFLMELEAQRASFGKHEDAPALYERLKVAVGAVSQNSSRHLAPKSSPRRLPPLAAEP